jgi:hypothetical protein
MTPAALFAAARASFERAADAASGRRTVAGVLAGRQVRLSFAGDFFERQLLRALAIDQANDRAAAADARDGSELRLHAWDARSSGVRLPSASWAGFTLTPSGIVAELSHAPYLVTLELHGALASMLDRDSGEAYHFVPDPSQLPAWETTHPARIVLATWARDRGLITCHAAAVADGDVGVLLCGSSGAGKSTTALGALAAGLRSAGDDYVLVEPGSPPVVHALYRSTLLEEAHYARHSRLMPVVDHVADQGDRRKAVMFAGTDGTPQVRGGFPLVALVALRVERGSTPAYAPTTAAAVLRALAPSTLAQLGMVDAAGLARLAALCRTLPAYELRLGDDPAPVPDLLRELIAEAAARSAAPALVG